MKKYIVPALLLLLCNEVISMAALAVMVIFGIYDLLNACVKGGIKL